MIRQTHDEWYAEMLRVYGNLTKVIFECPSCGHIQSIEDFTNLNLDVTRAYKDCIGCYVVQLGCDFSVDNGDCPSDKVRIIVTRNGNEIKVFNFVGCAGLP